MQACKSANRRTVWTSLLWKLIGCLLIVIVVESSPFPSLQHLNTVETDVTATHDGEHSTSGSRLRRTTDGIPERVHVKVHLGNDWVTFNVNRDTDVDVNIPLYRNEGDHVIRENGLRLEDRGLFKDPDTGAALLIQFHPRSKGVIRMFGTFHNEGQRYVIQPSNDVANNVDVIDVTNTSYAGYPNSLARHVIADVKAETITTNDGRLPHATLKYMKVPGPLRRKRGTSSLNDYKVELLIVTDYSVYQQWYSLTSGSSSQRKSQTKAFITQFYSYIMIDMNLRYDSVKNVPFTLKVLARGIVITEFASQSPWSTDNMQSNSLVDASGTLDDFTTWSTVTSSLPSRDHTMLFTGYDIEADGSPSSTGIAWTGSLCSDNSTSLVEDNFSFFGAATAAHELGHSLGAVHDGSGNPCSSNDNYVMSIQNSISSTPAKTKRLWVFSSCTIAAFQTYIDSMNRFGTNCMTSEDPESHTPTASQVAGAVYSPDELCQYNQGEGSYMCRSLQQLDTICSGMLCHRPGTSNVCAYILPAEGTSCGSGKWCSSGNCVADQRAPVMDESCPYGDQPGIVQFGQTCADVIRSNPGYCYQDFFTTKCCATCKLYADNSNQDCLYGDKSPSCSGLQRADCYNSNNEALCCGTCRRLRDDQYPGCVYGDRALGCQRSACAGYSPSDRLVCCETCGTPVSTTRSTTTPRTTTTTGRTTTTRTTPRTTTPTRITGSTPSSTTTPTSGITSPTTETTVPEETSDVLFIGIGAGAAVLVIIIIIIVIVCVIMRRRNQKSNGGLTVESTYDNIAFVPTSSPPRHPPPRRDNSTSHVTSLPSHNHISPPQKVVLARQEEMGLDGYMMPKDLPHQTEAAKVHNGFRHSNSTFDTDVAKHIQNGAVVYRKPVKSTSTVSSYGSGDTASVNADKRRTRSSASSVQSAGGHSGAGIPSVQVQNHITLSSSINSTGQPDLRKPVAVPSPKSPKKAPVPVPGYKPNVPFRGPRVGDEGLGNQEKHEPQKLDRKQPLIPPRPSKRRTTPVDKAQEEPSNPNEGGKRPIRPTLPVKPSMKPDNMDGEEV